MIAKKLLIVGLTLGMACTYFASAIPSLTTCGPVGSTTTGGTHNYDLDTDGILTITYDQCLDDIISDLLPDEVEVAIGHPIRLVDEYAAGISGAAYAAVTASKPYGALDPRSGGVSNCWAPSFTGHHGADTIINTADTVLGGDIRVFIGADWFDNVGESILENTTAAGNPVDVRDPCGDNVVDDDANDAWDDFFAVSDPCGPLTAPIAGVINTAPACATAGVNSYVLNTPIPAGGGPQPRGSTLFDNAGLDGGITTFYGLSLLNLSIATTGTSWTSTTQCSDGVNNDADGLIDSADPGCHSGPGGAYNPYDNSEANVAGTCSDGLDNNGVNGTDWADPVCRDATGVYHPEWNTE